MLSFKKYVNRGFSPFKRYTTRAIPKELTLKDFMSTSSETTDTGKFMGPPPYLSADYNQLLKRQRSPKRVFVETYGCQMNFSDTEILFGILQKEGKYERVNEVEDADVVFLMTCSIRENAENKIWKRLDALNALEKRKRRQMTIGVLGCMAERLKAELLERKRNVDIVCGPDAYRDIPRLIENAFEGQSGVNVILSADETYADIAPVRLDANKRSAFISIMRGCNNMCTYCIVPFTRGRERSRPISSIVEEVRRLSAEGIKEVTLLGQNVNSYCDTSILSSTSIIEDSPTQLSKGFRTIYKPKIGGKRFVNLLDQVSAVDGELRIRFTSPHPKDFPDDLLLLMAERLNICKQIHLPAQSGSSAVLENMRRGYTREAYIDLVNRIREIVPGVSLSSDFISGFCGESEEDHKLTLSLIKEVDYDMAYMYAYSMREKTAAHRKYADDVPEEVKQRRLAEVIDTFYTGLASKVQKTVGNHELVLVEGFSKKSVEDLAGRSDGGRTIVFPRKAIPTDQTSGSASIPQVGDYVHVRIERATGTTPIAEPTSLSSISTFGTLNHHNNII